jgi:hypothetical protein
MNSSEGKLRRVLSNRYNALSCLGKGRGVELTLVIGGMTGQERTTAVPVFIKGVEMRIAFSWRQADKVRP